ncbi:MAG: alpha amylase C-terminal domain-containing protein [Clostridia bacterium]|nr:alpha amylase C-terminal domain-containing protein [Clostridia bacterium]
MKYKILEIDPLLKPYENDIHIRMNNLKIKKKMLLKPGQKLIDFANGHHYFGIHRGEDGWYYREWAPGAEAMYLTGDFNGWQRHAHPLTKVGEGVWELFLPGRDALQNGQKVMAIVVHNGEELDRIPLYANYVVQMPGTIEWNAEICVEDTPFVWTDNGFRPEKKLFVYETHIGMAQEEARIGTYKEFEEKILPRIHAAGYNTLQIMAIMEHPYYASFGYQVTNFYAASSRFGKPVELKSLINKAHELGISVLLDVVHSHAAPNSREGLNMFDGTVTQFFHAGARGDHSAWKTKCFDYAKGEVIHFLLSNLKYWQEEFHFDGFRFDGVTSMLYHDHGLGTSFGSYAQYFSMNTDTDSVTYLQLANELVRQVNPHAITIAEDTSAMPGLCLPISAGGMGFDYRLAMGTPDMWIKILKERTDDQWDMWDLWLELTGRRPKEPVIGYVESHDQALVGDKTLMFRLCDKEMYWSMDKASQSIVIDRGMALHKMIRLLTLSLGGEGYLNFMGNEFGHPEWIDFPREGNGWSYQHCRRQWSLADNQSLRFKYLNEFDKVMISHAKRQRMMVGEPHQLMISQPDKTLVYERNNLVYAFNFHPTDSFNGYFIPVPQEGKYQVILTTDEYNFGGQNRIAIPHTYEAVRSPDANNQIGFRVYLPSRCAMVLKPVRTRKK